MSDHRHDASCRQDCRYRRLYEGTQASLGDMAAKHAHAINLHRQLRNEIISLMKRRWPMRFADAERNVGTRLAALDDEIILELLNAWLASERRAPAVPVDEPARPEPAPRPAPATEPVPAPRQVQDRAAAPQPAYLDEVPLPDEPPVSDESFENADQPASRPMSPGDLDGLFAPPQGSTDAPAQETAPEGSDEAAADALAALFGGEPAPATSTPVDDVREPGAAKAPEPSDDKPSKTQRPDRPKATTPDDAAPKQERKSGPAESTHVGLPLKPEVVKRSSGKKRNGRKTPRTRAVPPSGPTLDVPVELADGVEVDGDVTAKLLDLVTVPRPVFTSDLVKEMGDPKVVTGWERTIRGDLGAPVRVVAQKARHQQRGALVHPVADRLDRIARTGSSWWADAIEKYRRNQLYELAVLLHRVGDQVVSYQYEDELAVVRVSQRSGLAALVVVFGNRLSTGEQTADALVRTVEGLLKERLSLLALLPARGDVSDDMARLVDEEATRRGWKPSMPVVAAPSWEWADSSGAAATALLGV